MENDLLQGLTSDEIAGEDVVTFDGQETSYDLCLNVLMIHLLKTRKMCCCWATEGHQHLKLFLGGLLLSPESHDEDPAYDKLVSGLNLPCILALAAMACLEKRGLYRNFKGLIS